MQNFVRQCWSLSLKSVLISEKAEGIEDKRKWVKVNPKKVHEVQHFAHFIGNDCREDQVEHVVDIGSGLVSYFCIKIFEWKLNAPCSTHRAI